MAQVIYGNVNPLSLQLDDVYVAVLPPQPVLSGGSSTFNGGVVGMACWGPKNAPLNASTPQQLMALFGPPINSGYDIVQEGSLFIKQLPQGGVTAVRVSDGTDAAAVADFQDTAPANGLLLTALYTGTFGNQIKATLGPGSNSVVGALTWKVVIQAGAQVSETFDRIADGAAGLTWTNIKNAINNGIGSQGPSKFVVASLPGTPSVLEPAASQTITLAGGANGGAVNTAAQVGVDGGAGARTGMYALRQTGIDMCWLAGNSDSTAWSTLAQFAQSELAVGVGSLPKNTSVASAIAAVLGAGVNSPYLILMKDWVTFFDSFLGQNVSVPASCVAAGVCARLSSEQSPGNKPVYGILGTEATMGASPQPYSTTDLGQLEAAGINIVTNPIPAGATFGLRHGKCTSTNFATSEICYARKTNDLVRAFGSNVMGQFVNKVQSTAPNDPLREAVQAAFNAYLGPQQTAGLINAYSVTCDLTNNSPASIAAGILQADVVVAYMAVVDKFVINLTAGQTVQVVSTNAQNQLNLSA